MFSCKTYTNQEIIGEYCYDFSRNDYSENTCLKLMSNDSFNYVYEFGSIGQMFSSGKWQKNGNRLFINSYYQINDSFVKIYEYEKSENSSKDIVTFQLVCGDEFINYPIDHGIFLYLNSYGI